MTWLSRLLSVFRRSPELDMTAPDIAEHDALEKRHEAAMKDATAEVRRHRVLSVESAQQAQRVIRDSARH